jgi:hypothetical protein
MENLKVPYGLNSLNELVSAEEAIKGVAYNCPCCSSQLVHRAGEIRASHFAHSSDSNCSLESILHITAKKMIVDTINTYPENLKKITLRNHCQDCGVEFNTELPFNTFTGAKEEVRIAEYLCDVVGYRNDTKVALAIEILNTHEVDSKKANNLPIYWIELKADDVIVNPYEWNPTQSQLKASSCTDCKNHTQHVQEIASKWGIDHNLYSAIKNPSSVPYIADTEICFKCKEEIPVFWWQGVPFCEKEPPNPKPKTIKYRNSKQYGGSYWANTCAKCNMIQGDNYLFIFDNAPFKRMPMSNKSASLQTGHATSEFMKIINRNF